MNLYLSCILKAEKERLNFEYMHDTDCISYLWNNDFCIQQKARLIKK